MSAIPDFDSIAAEMGLSVGQSTARAFSVTAEPYVVLTDACISPEGSDGAYVAGGTEPEAWARYEAIFRRYLETAGWSDRNARGLPPRVGGAVYWRVRPRCEFHEAAAADPKWTREATPAFYRIYSRILVSDREPVADLVAEAVEWESSEAKARLPQTERQRTQFATKPKPEPWAIDVRRTSAAGPVETITIALDPAFSASDIGNLRQHIVAALEALCPMPPRIETELLP